MIYLTLAFEFFKIGLFSIGGGMATLPFLMDLTTKYDWYTASDLANLVAISESTPGPIGINIATYIGTELYGIPGGIIATIGEVLPSIVTIVLISKFFSKFQEKPLVKSVFKTLRPVTSGLVLCVLVQVFTLAILNLNPQNSNSVVLQVFNLPALSIFVVSLFVLFKTKVHPVVVVAFGAVFGVVFF